jgi:hypothetical protein
MAASAVVMQKHIQNRKTQNSTVRGTVKVHVMERCKSFNAVHPYVGSLTTLGPSSHPQRFQKSSSPAPAAAVVTLQLTSSSDALTATLLLLQLLNLAAGCCCVAWSLLSMPADCGRALALLQLSWSAGADDLRVCAAPT